MMTQVSAPTPTKNPLTTRDRQFIEPSSSVGLFKRVQTEDVVTIWINRDDIVWVKDDPRLCSIP